MTLEEVGEALAAKVKAAIDPLREENKSLRTEVETLKEEIKTLKEAEPTPGKDGKDGVDGKDGKDGVDGKDGANGIDGKDGRDGIDGKDGADIEFLPAIDPEKEYPRGTYALHNNGIWRTHQKATGLHGWECLVAGVADVQLDFTDDDQLKIVVMDSTGKTYETSRSIPFFHYKGLYSENTQYKHNDLATYAGSLWIAEKDAPEGVPGRGETDWTLVTKRGRDGKSILDIARKEWGFKGSGAQLLEKLYSGKNPDDPVAL